MMIVNVCKASPLQGEEVRDAHIAIDQPLPEFESLDGASAFYRAEAAQIAAALKSLPQGTRHQLLLLLLEQAPVFYRGA